MKLIIAGSRTLNVEWEFIDGLAQNHWNIFPEFWPTEVVCGGAKGIDEVGRGWAEYLKIPVKMFPADWDKYGKSAGYRRNEEMANYADALLAIWDGESSGTYHMINIMQNRKKPVYKVILNATGVHKEPKS
jgi:hypothetical protein